MTILQPKIKASRKLNVESDIGLFLLLFWCDRKTDKTDENYFNDHKVLQNYRLCYIWKIYEFVLINFS